MTNPVENNDFIQPPVSNNDRKSTAMTWIGAGLGCGCLSLILVGILGAILLPGFLKKPNKTKESEAKIYMTMIIRSQQVYFSKKGVFADDIEQLEIKNNSGRFNYRYQVVSQKDKRKSVIITAQAIDYSLKSYTGAVFAIKKKEDAIAVGAICETNKPGPISPSIPETPISEFSEIKCPSDSRLVMQSPKPPIN